MSVHMRKKLSIIFAALFLVFASLGQTLSVLAQESSKPDTTSGASEKKYTDPAELKESYDVVVVGSGGGGMAAAIAAHDAGANVVIFEKMPIVGGNTSKSSAGMNASETKFQKEAGIEDSNDKFYEETFKGGKEKNDPELLRFLVDHSASATERKIPTFVNSDVTEITEENGAVSGVKVTVEGQEKTIKSKAVVLATGGFGANLDMVSQLKPELKGFVTTNQEGSQGDGIKMAEKLGAQTVDLDQIQIHPSVEQKTSYLITEAVRGEGAILINQEGKRFFNELETRDKVSAAIIGQEGKSAYVVFDEALKGRVKAINQYESKGLVVKGDTIEDLAKEIGVDPANLKASLETWNKSVADKKDEEFGRTTGMDNDLSQAPYYAIKIAPGIHHTMGGLKTNTNAQVLNKENQPIKGLYASGEVTGGVHGANRIGGNAVADIIIFGRQAGEQSAAFVKE